MESDKTNITDFGLWTLINQKFNYLVTSLYYILAASAISSHTAFQRLVNFYYKNLSVLHGNLSNGSKWFSFSTRFLKKKS